MKNEGKSRKTVIVAKELAVFSARITGMKMSIAKLLENPPVTEGSQLPPSLVPPGGEEKD